MRQIVALDVTILLKLMHPIAIVFLVVQLMISSRQYVLSTDRPTGDPPAHPTGLCIICPDSHLRCLCKEGPYDLRSERTDCVHFESNDVMMFIKPDPCYRTMVGHADVCEEWSYPVCEKQRGPYNIRQYNTYCLTIFGWTVFGIAALCSLWCSCTACTRTLP